MRLDRLLAPGLAAAVALAGLAVAGGPATQAAPATAPDAVAADAVDADYEGYVFAYFAGESTADGEKIYLAASKGDDPLDYDELNDGRPILESTFGERGLRDPFLIRSADGETFYLLATDLRIFGGNDFGNAQERGSKYLEIWESDDLVHWSEQRHVKVSSDYAGNTWAPEAYYDEGLGQYVVYWASALYPTTETDGRDIATSYQRMMYATTTDFRTFSTPQPWVDVSRGGGRGMIDATVQLVGDTYYRIIKDEATFTVRQEKSPSLTATVTGSLPTTTSPATGWQLVKERVGSGQANPWGGTFDQGEGPTMFQDNEDPDRWYLFIDQPSYHGGQGYLAFQTDDLPSGDWVSVPTADLPSSPRHGTVLPVTQEELDVVRAGWQPELLVASVEDAAVSTRQGTTPALPATVPAAFGDGSTGEVRVEWDGVDPAAYAAPGTFTVQGEVVEGSADDPVATVTVTDLLDPVVDVGAVPTWSTSAVAVPVTATDETGVAAVETALDDAAWTSTDGATASVAVADDGVHTVRARALDTTGNRSAPVERVVRVDTTDPVSRATLSGRRVTVRAADGTSGVERIETRTPGGSWTAYDEPVAVPRRGGTVEYRAVDVSGNVEPVNRLVVPAATPAPVASSVLAVAASPRVRLGQTVRVWVRVAGTGATPRGVVRLVDGGRVVATASLDRAGRAALAVPARRLGTGRSSLVVRYAGSAAYRPGSDRVMVRVLR
jgi:hypothetical protein